MNDRADDLNQVILPHGTLWDGTMMEAFFQSWTAFRVKYDKILGKSHSKMGEVTVTDLSSPSERPFSVREELKMGTPKGEFAKTHPLVLPRKSCNALNMGSTTHIHDISLNVI